ncbi:hypothetical protein BsWGS_02861 [Bradybaena similaris]
MTDTYLRRAAPLLHTYWNTLHDITCKDLILHRRAEVMYIPLKIHVSVPFIVFAKNEVKQHHRLHGGEVKTDAEALYLTELVKVYNDQLKSVVLKELLAGQELQKKDMSLKRKVRKLTELKNSVDEFSKVVDRISAAYTAKSLDFTSTKNLPSLEDIKDVKEKLCKMKRTLKFNELCSLFEKYDFKTTDEAILCTILGLREDYGEWLFEMDLQMRKHHADKYYIERAIEENEKSADWIQSGFYEADYLLKYLQDLGFSEETAAIISSNIPNDLINLQKPSFWAMRYLDNVFTNHPLLSNCPRYPEHADTLDAWFEVPLNNSDEPSGAPINVKMINLSSSTNANNLLVETYLRSGEVDGTHHILYHSTDHISAMSIVKEGIILTKGKKEQDFSSGDGFYLSEKFENAKLWTKACKGKQAIIVYKIENNLLDAGQQAGWDFTERDRAEWERVIKYCRSGYSINDKNLKKELKNIAFIRGPMCTNPQQFVKGGYSQGFNNRDAMQVCIRGDDYAENFGRLENIYCVIFY